MTPENTPSLDDATLIEMTIAGQTKCFSVLMNRHSNAAKRCIHVILNRNSDIEDVLQNTFLKVWVNLSSFRFEASFQSWLIRIAMNEALTYRRYGRSRPYFSDGANLDTLACSRDSPEQLVQRSEAAKEIRLALPKLPSKYREIVSLCEIQQLTAVETARHLKSSVALVKARRFRARKMLCAALKRKDSKGQARHQAGEERYVMDNTSGARLSSKVDQLSRSQQQSGI